MTTKYFLLSIYIILRITVSCQTSTAFQIESSTVTQTIFAQVFSNSSTTPLSSSLNQNPSIRNETTTPPSTNNITLRNETVTPPSTNNITLRNETATPPSTNNITLTNETVTPPSTNNITLRNETVTPPSTNNITLRNETVTSPSSNNITLRNETVTPPSSNNITLRNETTTPPSTNNITLRNETTTPPSTNNITVSNETMTTSSSNMTTSSSNMTTFSSNITTNNETTMNQTTIIYDLPGGTDEPARPGEYSSKLKMGCKFKKKFNQKYKDKSSKEYLDFTNDIFFTMRLNLKKYFRLIMIIFISIDSDDNDNGISMTIEFVLASTTVVSSNELTNNVQSATTTAYGSSISVSNVNITQESAIVQSTATNPTTITSTTIKPTTIVYDLAGGTDEPPRPGEYSSKVKMGCSFTKRNFHANLRIKTSIEYIEFANEIFFTMRWNLRRYLRLIMITFLSIEPGSILTNMEMSFASNTSVPSTNLSNFVQSAAIASFGDSINIFSASVSQESTLVTPTTTSSPNTVPGWGIFLIILACAVVITAVILLTVFGLKYEKSRSRNLEPYLNETPSDRKGILLQRSRMYDSM